MCEEQYPSDQEYKHGDKLLSTRTSKVILGIFYHPPSPTPEYHVQLALLSQNPIQLYCVETSIFSLSGGTVFSPEKSEGNAPGAILG